MFLLGQSTYAMDSAVAPSSYSAPVYEVVNDVYTVTHGDTLGKIAEHFGVTVYQLATKNSIHNINLIYVGQNINIDVTGIPEVGQVTQPTQTQPTQTQNQVQKQVQAPNPSSQQAPQNTQNTQTQQTQNNQTSKQQTGLNWAALAQCESGGNPNIVSANGLYHGLYQFNVQTWQSVGGSGLPSQASAAEQLKRAEILYASRGAQPWPTCGVNLYK